MPHEEHNILTYVADDEELEYCHDCELSFSNSNDMLCATDTDIP